MVHWELFYLSGALELTVSGVGKWGTQAELRVAEGWVSGECQKTECLLSLAMCSVPIQTEVLAAES